MTGEPTVPVPIPDLLVAIEELAAEKEYAAILAARIETLEQALRECDECFVEIRNDWTDPRGSIRQGRNVIARVLAAQSRVVSS